MRVGVAQAPDELIHTTRVRSEAERRCVAHPLRDASIN
jgi:hypothetical protein